MNFSQIVYNINKIMLNIKTHLVRCMVSNARVMAIFVEIELTPSINFSVQALCLKI